MWHILYKYGEICIVKLDMKIVYDYSSKTFKYLHARRIDTNFINVTTV